MSRRLGLAAMVACARVQGAVVSQRATARWMASGEGSAAKRVLVPIADGSEEIETSCITDTLVRAGASVVVASANVDESLTVTMSRGLKIVADVHASALGDDDWDLVAIPGGMPGAANLAKSDDIQRIIRKQASSSNPLGAVCAAPAVVLEPLGVLDGRTATCYPAPQFVQVLGEKAVAGDVVHDGNVITSRGPGTSLKFALTCVECLYGRDTADALADQMLVTRE
eukprot:CAMPEP_0197422622 /NCGR_PEP_ID=MMETSP1170-20131217/17170_1 /TAXON_ID=54406 /ORGANISM="Sarcinochrysis sp, Strain CCMP770" /LENGTH=225 /DNA_ID=CAMNT_0042949973 /DNA_START=8 /DNA_END=688 /DNA_ORIENTATION=+